MDWSPKKRATAITLRKERYSYREVAAKLVHGVTPSGIRKLFKRFQETGSVENKTGRGRNRLTTPKTDRHVTRLALNNRRLHQVISTSSSEDWASRYLTGLFDAAWLTLDCEPGLQGKSHS